MKNTNFSLKVFFIILFLSSIILSFFSDDFSFLPKEFNFDSILYLLIPALVLNSNLDDHRVDSSKTLSAKIIDTVFMSLFSLAYVSYVLNLFMLYIQTL
ncbi:MULTISPECIES: hypothetical protein [Trichococcus]|uniref:Uncharacterized protein n=2 Tax=Trichococcus TaxID=82802 RepID=A0AB38BIU9_9LACT|nr:MULTISPECIES: hypothetical protein [Trichococcus]CZQ97555.1 Hypothetical protein TFLO_2218 [Trichococcus flocculiformis]SFE91143.1 hypothetical protein SAMN04488086_11493 [Trichococcus pasteurii]SFH89204.1 hypothetical protein SAMN04488507_102331 [Trichococcus flocculiformis]SLM52236.1 Hypothetical protein TPAS_1930 [Trichococcus pasteurii]SSB93117.1 Hypothetical protein TPAS_1930 [Trichococcus pasteurii]